MQYGTLASKNEKLASFWDVCTQARWHVNHAAKEARWHVDHVGRQALMGHDLANSLESYNAFLDNYFFSKRKICLEFFYTFTSKTILKKKATAKFS